MTTADDFLWFFNPPMPTLFFNLMPCVQQADSGCDLDRATRREFSAFVGAVNQSYGEQQAERAAGYWLERFGEVEIRAGQECADLRQVSIQAASRVAVDVTGIPFGSHPQHALGSQRL